MKSENVQSILYEYTYNTDKRVSLGSIYYYTDLKGRIDPFNISTTMFPLLLRSYFSGASSIAFQLGYNIRYEKLDHGPDLRYLWLLILLFPLCMLICFGILEFFDPPEIKPPSVQAKKKNTPEAPPKYSV